MNFRNGNYITSNLLDREFGIIEFLVLFYDLDCRMLEFNPVGLVCECCRMSLLLFV